MAKSTTAKSEIRVNSERCKHPYAGQFPTWYFVLYFGCTLDFMSRSCACRRYDGQEVDRGSPRARDPCTNAQVRCGIRSQAHASTGPAGRHLAPGRGLRHHPGTAALSLARRRSRWRRPRYPRPVASRLPGGHTLFSQALEGPRASARAIGHRQAEQRQGCAPSGHAVRRPSHGPIREQPRRGVAATDATARATDAPVQIRCARAAVSLGPRTRAESLPSRATSTSVGAPPRASDAGVSRMGCGDVGLLNDERYRAIEGSSRPPLINLTVSMIPRA